MPAVIFGLSSVSTTSLFALISFYDQLNSVAIGIIVCLFVFTMTLPSASFIITSRVTLRSQDFLKQLSEIRSSQLVKRKIKSVSPLRVFIGILFHVKSETVLTFFNVLLNNVITLILSFGK